MYDTTLGRFLSRDPLGIMAGSINYYAYADASPMGSGDTMGLALPKYSAHFSNWDSATDDELHATPSYFRSQFERKDLIVEVSGENVRDLIEIIASSRPDRVREEARKMLALQVSRKALMEYVRQNVTRVPVPAVAVVRPFAGWGVGRVIGLIQDLTSDEFQTRKKATEQLETYDLCVAPFLRQYIAVQKPTLELTRRIEMIATRVESRLGITVQQQAMLDVLSLIARDDETARSFVQEIAKGWEESRVTQYAKSKLK
jgi:hypothetical protein